MKMKTNNKKNKSSGIEKKKKTFHRIERQIIHIQIYSTKWSAFQIYLFLDSYYQMNPFARVEPNQKKKVLHNASFLTNFHV